MHSKQQILDMFLTKEAFEQYAKQLREERAAKYGMTLEEWDKAVLNGEIVQPFNSGSSFRSEF